MISVEFGFLIIKINTAILMAIFLYGLKVKRLGKSEAIIMATMLDWTDFLYLLHCNGVRCTN